MDYYPVRTGNNTINAGQGNDLLTGNGGADEVIYFNEEGDKATGNCENIDKGNKNKK